MEWNNRIDTNDLKDRINRHKPGFMHGDHVKIKADILKLENLMVPVTCLTQQYDLEVYNSGN